MKVKNWYIINAWCELCSVCFVPRNSPTTVGLWSDVMRDVLRHVLVQDDSETHYLRVRGLGK